MAEYKFQSVDIPAEQKLEIAQQGLWGLVARMVKIIEDRYGKEGLDVLYDGLRDWDSHELNVPGMLSAFGIQPGEASPAEFIQRVMNPYDDVSFIQKEKPIITDAPDENRVLYKIKSCSVADAIHKEYPGTCRLICSACLEGQRRVANPNLKISVDNFLCEGADACEIYVEKING